MRRALSLAVTATLLTLVASVPSGGAAMPCDATTLPALIKAKAPGTVLVPPGVYCGDVFLPAGTKLISLEGAARTTIVGGTHGVLFDHGEFFEVVGFTITGAALDGIHQDDGHHGGAIGISDNVFQGNGRWGVNLLTMHDAFVERNNFRGNGVGGARMAGEMMMGMSYQVNRNVFLGEPIAIAYEEGVNGRIIGNVIADGEVGVQVRAWTSLRVYENHFLRLDRGVDLAGTCTGGVPSNVLFMAIFDNRFSENQDGLVAGGGLDCGGQPYGVEAVTVEQNSFVGSRGYAIDASSDLHMGVINANRNYWGSDLGPSVAMRAPGLGDMVSLGVDASQWCTRMACPPDLQTFL